MGPGPDKQDDNGSNQTESSSLDSFMKCIAKMGHSFNKAAWSFSVFTKVHLTSTFSFWVVKTMLILIEPILVALERTFVNLAFQYTIAILSTVLFIIQILGESSRRFEEIETYFVESQYVSSLDDEDDDEDNSITTSTASTNSYFIHCIVFFFSRTDYLLEAICLVGALVFIFNIPHLATLRLFRVFCLLWYHELAVFRNGAIRWAHRLFGLSGLHLLIRLFDVMQFATLSLISVGSEMFFLNDTTRGGLILMGILFYMAYVMGLMVHIALSSNASLDDDAFQVCETIFGCMWTYLRLTFFDGNGLDLVYGLSVKFPWLGFLSIIYLCVTSFGMINGLLSTFANSFTQASEEAFDGEERKDTIREMELYVRKKNRQMSDKMRKAKSALDSFSHQASSRFFTNNSQFQLDNPLHAHAQNINVGSNDVVDNKQPTTNAQDSSLDVAATGIMDHRKHQQDTLRSRPLSDMVEIEMISAGSTAASSPNYTSNDTSIRSTIAIANRDLDSGALRNSVRVSPRLSNARVGFLSGSAYNRHMPSIHQSDLATSSVSREEFLLLLDLVTSLHQKIDQLSSSQSAISALESQSI